MGSGHEYDICYINSPDSMVLDAVSNCAKKHSCNNIVVSQGLVKVTDYSKQALVGNRVYLYGSCGLWAKKWISGCFI